jgi:hypothetical protein
LPLEGERYTCLFYRPSPLALVAFITKFLALHLALILALGALWLGWTAAAAIAVTLTGLLAITYAWPDVRRYGLLQGCAFAALRYAADSALFIGALIGGLHQRMLYLSATID